MMGISVVFPFLPVLEASSIRSKACPGAAFLGTRTEPENLPQHGPGMLLVVRTSRFFWSLAIRVTLVTSSP